MIPPLPSGGDLPGAIHLQNRAAKAMADGAPMDLFNWEPKPKTVPFVIGPGRCTECSFHVATQGHREGCSTTAPLWLDESDLEHNLRSLERWESRQEEKRRAAWEAKPRNDSPKGDERDRALGILQWAEDRLSGKTEGERDDKTKDCIYFLGKFVNDGHLTRAEVSDAVLRASMRNKHYPENKSINQIESDVDRGLAVVRTDGVHVDWDQMDRWNR